MQSWWLIALSICSGVAGQTAIKLGVGQPGAAQDQAGVIDLIFLIVKSPMVLLGLMLYGVGALAWIGVLSRLNLSYAYPFLALNFVLITIVSYLVLGEPIPLMRWFGICIICTGILFVAQSSL